MNQVISKKTLLIIILGMGIFAQPAHGNTYRSSYAIPCGILLHLAQPQVPLLYGAALSFLLDKDIVYNACGIALGYCATSLVRRAIKRHKHLLFAALGNTFSQELTQLNLTTEPLPEPPLL